MNKTKLGSSTTIGLAYGRAATYRDPTVRKKPSVVLVQRKCCYAEVKSYVHCVKDVENTNPHSSASTGTKDLGAQGGPPCQAKALLWRSAILRARWERCVL